MAGLGVLGWLQVAGTAASVGGTIAQGRNQKMISDWQADQLEKAEKHEQAAAQREASQHRRRAEYAQSRAQALAASSGAGVSDKTVIDIMEGIEEEGEYRALMSIYKGEVGAQDLRNRAALARAEGQDARNASYLRAGSTIAGSGSSLYAKYG